MSSAREDVLLRLSLPQARGLAILAEAGADVMVERFLIEAQKRRAAWRGLEELRRAIGLAELAHDRESLP